MTFLIGYGMNLSKVFARLIIPKIGHTTSIFNAWLWNQTLLMKGDFLDVSHTSTHGAARKNFGSTLKIVRPLTTGH